MPRSSQNLSQNKPISTDDLRDVRVRSKVVTEVFSKSYEETMLLGNAKNIAGYVWVKSSGSESSLDCELAKKQCADLISHIPNGRLIKFYADNNDSRSTKDTGTAFQKMLDDCKSGSIDLIITQSMSLFHGNATLCVKYINELLALPHPVGVYFEKEKINSLDPSTKSLLNFLAILAEEEKNYRKRRKHSTCLKRKKKLKT